MKPRKTNKSLLKRIRITKNKKIMKRRLGQAHYNAKQSGEAVRNKRKNKKMSKSDFRIIKKLLPEF